MNVLLINQLSYRYYLSQEIFYKNFSFFNGITVFYGNSGIGKSTFFSLLMREKKPNEGDIFFNQDSIFTLDYSSYVEKIIAIVLQGGKMSSYFSLKEYIDILGYSRGGKAGETEKYIKLLKLEALYNKNISQCSGGERYRLSFFLALMKEKKIFLLDEPTAYLDYQNSVLLINVIEEIKDTIIIVISHDTLFFNNEKYEYYSLG